MARCLAGSNPLAGIGRAEASKLQLPQQPDSRCAGDLQGGNQQAAMHAKDRELLSTPRAQSRFA